MNATCPRWQGDQGFGPRAARCALVKLLCESGAALRDHEARMRSLGMVRCGTTHKFFRRPGVAVLGLTIDGPTRMDETGKLFRGPWAPAWAVMVAAWTLQSTHSIPAPGHRDGRIGACDVKAVSPVKRVAVLAWLAGLDPADRDAELQAIQAIKLLAGPNAARRAAVEKAEAAL